MDSLLTENLHQKTTPFDKKNYSLVYLVSVQAVCFAILMFFRALFSLKSPDAAASLAAYKSAVFNLLTLPPSFKSLLQKPWAIVTQMIVHDEAWRFLGNMIWLVIFGSFLTGLTGNKKIIPIYIYGSVAGAVGFIVFQQLFHSMGNDALWGAEAGTVAIAVALTSICPNYRIFVHIRGGAPVWVLTAVYLFVVFVFIEGKNISWHFACLCSGLAGFLFIYLHRLGIDLGAWMNRLYEKMQNIFSPKNYQASIKNELFYYTTTQPFKRTLKITEKNIDHILDKINEVGYSNLTPEEKETLYRAGSEGMANENLSDK